MMKVEPCLKMLNTWDVLKSSCVCTLFHLSVLSASLALLRLTAADWRGYLQILADVCISTTCLKVRLQPTLVSIILVLSKNHCQQSGSANSITHMFYFLKCLQSKSLPLFGHSKAFYYEAASVWKQTWRTNRTEQVHCSRSLAQLKYDW